MFMWFFLPPHFEQSPSFGPATLSDLPPAGFFRAEPAVQAAIDYIHSHISQVFGVEALIDVSGLPRRSFELAFRRATGLTPYAYLTRARLARARELLRSAERPTLTDVAAACGFRDLRRFRLTFRRELGISPSEFRNPGLIPVHA